MPSPVSTNAKLNYSVAPEAGVRAYVHINADPLTGVQKRNHGREDREVTLESVRGKEAEYTLDNCGFQYFKHTSKHTSFLNDDEVVNEYYPESIELLKKLTGASRVELFDHTIRRRRPGEADDSPTRRQPVSQVHVDQTTASAIARVHRHLPAEDAPKLLEKRFQLINLWRPIENPAIDWPLALCDYRSVEPEKDTFPVALVFPEREGEVMGVQYSPKHNWKYLHGMTPDEIVLIKCFDSDEDVARFTPHTAFYDSSSPEGTPLRQSIELRALVFYD
ncbi:hypothetical protein D9619_010600 [Psilocybe cf. subviscida]|uniref:Methyltransferase n=1 Tax=Psilocybe cf. subviscida TaxID=2480587 RepID=A0A8H5AS01_9AGAR|nr:hypothetical protein D9619_010600 [Psilocybe cf. subviscida]